MNMIDYNHVMIFKDKKNRLYLMILVKGSSTVILHINAHTRTSHTLDIYLILLMTESEYDLVPKVGG